MPPTLDQRTSTTHEIEEDRRGKNIQFIDAKCTVAEKVTKCNFLGRRFAECPALHFSGKNPEICAGTNVHITLKLE
jgi:hypothetical protein